jgi:hypothetical protein
MGEVPVEFDDEAKMAGNGFFPLFNGLGRGYLVKGAVYLGNIEDFGIISEPFSGLCYLVGVEPFFPIFIAPP